MASPVTLPVPRDVDASDIYMRVLIYGESGTGKTLLAASAARHPDLQPVLYLNFDDGMASITHIEGIREVQIKSNNEMLAVANQLILPEDQRKPEYRGFKTLVIDSITSWRDQTMTELVKRAVTTGQRQEMTTQIQDFGQMSFTLASIMGGLRQMPYHIIITAGIEKETVNEVVVKAMPLIQPKLRETISYMMGYIWYTMEKDGNFRLLTLPKGVQRIKTRNPRFVKALKEKSVELARKAGVKTPENNVGWFDIKLDDDDIPLPGIDQMFNLFKQSSSRKERDTNG